MKKNRVDLKLTKKWGMYNKGHEFKNLDRAFARSIQDVEKVGKIIEPNQNKADEKAAGRATK